MSDCLHRLETIYDDRFAREYGPWRPVVAQVADRFLACGVLEHDFARIRCDACTHEYLLAFSCKCRYVCPSCRAKRLAIWTQWLDTTLLAPVPHRQVVLTIPTRLRAYCLYRRRLLGEIARVAARTVTAAIRTLTCEPDLAVGIVACLQTHGSRANWHPHLHLLVTDGGFRPDGTFVSWPVHDTARLTEAFRRAVLRLFVPPPLRRPPSSPRHDSRRPRPAAGGLPCSSRFSRSTRSRARPAMAPCGSSRSSPRPR
ncbi:MAG: transposase zinc-binding domain-containing protein [Gemmatimonadaceae bacterium]|nr:transposase zinc-binding domain-containing protein [Gemmatimonadaceae bacterium]